MSLSDKINEWKGTEESCINTDDVKEFIKDLKGIVLESLDPRIDTPLFEERIDKLAGDKLI